MNTIAKNFLVKALALGVAAISLCAESAYATSAVTIDLRASAFSGGFQSGAGKTATISPGGSGTLTLQVWAQVSNTVASAVNPFGIAQISGSILSSSTGNTSGSGISTGYLSTDGLAASPGNIAFGTPFGGGPAKSAGQGASLAPADSIQDLGTTSGTAPTSATVTFSKDFNSNGSQVGAVFYASNLNQAGSTMNTLIANQSYEFLMGTVTLTITNFSDANTSPTVSLNWVVVNSWSSLNKQGRALFTGGDNTNGNGFATVPTVGASVVISSVPEPSAFGMVMIGALGLVGFRRLGLRRKA